MSSVNFCSRFSPLTNLKYCSLKWKLYIQNLQSSSKIMLHKNYCQASYSKQIDLINLGSLPKSSLVRNCFHTIQILSARDIWRITLRSLSTQPNIPPKRKSKTDVKSTVTWKTVLTTAVIGGSLMAFMFYVKKEKDLAIQRERRRALGKAKIGGSFDLIDHNGQPRKSEGFIGQWLLIYFGFTHCPDICPDELEKMAQVVDNIDSSKILANGIQPIFITVDPLRDSVEAVKKYVAEFHPKLIGLTGSVEKIAEACKAYRVYFSSGPKDDDEDYIVDHTIIIYLVDPDGNFVDYYGQNSNADQMTGSISLNIKKFEALQRKGILGVLQS